MLLQTSTCFQGRFWACTRSYRKCQELDRRSQPLSVSCRHVKRPFQTLSFCFGFFKDFKFIPTFRSHLATVITIKLSLCFVFSTDPLCRFYTGFLRSSRFIIFSALHKRQFIELLLPSCKRGADLLYLHT